MNKIEKGNIDKGTTGQADQLLLLVDSDRFFYSCITGMSYPDSKINSAYRQLGMYGTLSLRRTKKMAKKESGGATLFVDEKATNTTWCV